MAKTMRLDKFLAACGYGTRNEVKKMLKQSLVTVDGEIEKDQGFQVDISVHKVECSGEEAHYKQYVYILLNKPDGVVSATGDRWHDTVLDLLDGAYAGHSMFPVGRLDRDTTGLLLLTDDGVLAHDLLSPKKHVQKTYVAELDKAADSADIAAFSQGIVLEDFTTKPARLVMLGGNRVEVILTEGKFHQIKRMFEARGKQVLSLQRTAMGPLTLDDSLQPGDWRELTEEETLMLKEGQAPLQAT